MPAWKLFKTPTDVVAQIDWLLDEHTDTEIAKILALTMDATSSPVTASSSADRSAATRRA